jgi:hypothetical protein
VDDAGSKAVVAGEREGDASHVIKATGKNGHGEEPRRSWFGLCFSIPQWSTWNESKSRLRSLRTLIGWSSRWISYAPYPRGLH